MTALTAPARWDVGVPDTLEIVGMPMLERHVDANPGTLDGVVVLYINHAISDALMVARGLRRSGAQLVSVLVNYHGETGPDQLALRQAFTALGPCLHPEPAHPLRFQQVMTETVGEALRRIGDLTEASGQPWMIVEDGGYAFPAMHDNPALRPLLRRCLGAIEHTSRGRWNYEYAEFDGVPQTARRLRRPAVTISGSALKTAHEGGFVAQALVDECGFLLRRHHQFLRHRKVAVLGYGRVGRPLAYQLRAAGCEVLIVDPAAGADLPFGMRPATLTQCLTEGVFLIFGATGTSSLPAAALTMFLDHPTSEVLYLASASSKAVEFAELTHTLERAAADPSPCRPYHAAVTAETDPQVGTLYRIRLRDGRRKRVVLLGNGYPVIFYPSGTHGAPNRAMDPVMTQLYLAAAGLPARADLPPRVHDLTDLRRLERLPAPWANLIDEAGLLAEWCGDHGLDWATYRRAIGFPTTTRPQE